MTNLKENGQAAEQDENLFHLVKVAQLITDTGRANLAEWPTRASVNIAKTIDAICRVTISPDTSRPAALCRWLAQTGFTTEKQEKRTISSRGFTRRFIKILVTRQSRSMMPEIPRQHSFLLALFVGVVTWLFGIFVKFPQGLLTTTHFPRLEDYLKLCANPFARDVNPILAYRISVPIIAWAFHLPPVLCTFLPILFLIASYAIIFYVVLERTADKKFSVLVVAGLSLTFFAHWTNRWLGFPDSFSHLVSALALISSNPLLLALCCIFGMLNDERWLFSVPFLLFWHGSNLAKVGKFSSMTAARAGIGLGVGILFVILIRHALTIGWLGPGIAEPNVYKIMRSTLLDLNPLNSTWTLFALNIFMGLGWYWLAVGKLITRQLLSTSPILGCFLSFSILIAGFSTLVVEDVSRSMGFLFLVVVIASVYDYNTDHASARIWWRNLLLATAITPTIYYTGLSGAAFIPFPIDLINHLIHQYGGDDLLQNLKPWFHLRAD
jgi:hypothetical protein